MKPEIIFAKLRKGAGGTFRTLRAGERIEEGDIYALPASCDYVSESVVGQNVVKGDAILRLEFEK